MTASGAWPTGPPRRHVGLAFPSSPTCFCADCLARAVARSPASCAAIAPQVSSPAPSTVGLQPATRARPPGHSPVGRPIPHPSGARLVTLAEAAEPLFYIMKSTPFRPAERIRQNGSTLAAVRMRFLNLIIHEILPKNCRVTLAFGENVI